MINETLKFTVLGKTYLIKDLNVGKFIDIERMKAVLSGGMYGSMIRMVNNISEEALTMIDMNAYLTVLCPEVIKDLKCDSINDLGLEDYNQLREAYQSQLIPWINKQVSIVTQKEKKEEKNE